MDDTTPEPGWETAAERKLRLAAPAPVAQWEHDPARTPEAETAENKLVMAELGLSWADLHTPSRGRCLGCWCYSCGGRTDRPRDRRGDTRTGLAEPDSHRWCYE